MFRARDPQESLWQSQFLVTPKKAKRLEGSWAEVFRNEALPLIDEELFAPMYCADNGRPNRAVQTVLGVHLLKEMFNFTDGEALEQLEFNLLWHHALRLDIEETHLPQKTLHNFRVRLMQHDGGRLAFQETTDRIIQAGSKRLLATYLQTLLAYPDGCTRGETVFDPRSGDVIVQVPPLSEEKLYPKEKALIDLVAPSGWREGGC